MVILLKIVDYSLKYCIYILSCKTGHLYTGYTNNLKRRFAEHEKGTASKFTSARRPVTLVYKEYCSSRIQAIRREGQIKTMSRKKKFEMCKAG